jgi:penicillin-insensitive murein endopeptidase
MRSELGGWAFALRVAVILLALCSCATSEAADRTSANALFGAMSQPTPDQRATVIGSYTSGCIRGAVPLPINGPGWQVMRLSRNRNWGHPNLVSFVERFAADVRGDGWPGLLIGDMAQPRGGPMSSGHASHQVGLDVDIWLNPMPGHLLSIDERESLSAVSLVKTGKYQVDPARFSLRHTALIRRAALFPEVERIFVNPGIKKALCATAGEDKAWLAKVRPWYGHDAHFHVRLRCPEGQTSCRPQQPTPKGDGCGGDLSWWLSQTPWFPKDLPGPARPTSLSSLPAACRAVLKAR